MKKMIFILPIILFFSTVTPNAADFVTINDPIESGYGSVNGNPTIFYGTSSQPNMEIGIFLNGAQITSTYTDMFGNWRSSYPLCNGTYTLSASLITPYLATLALETTTFTVDNGTFLNTNTPAQGSTVFINPIILSGTASLANATINISCDGTFVASTTTNNNGNWQYSYILNATNGSHTFLIELLDPNHDYYYDDYGILASNTINITSNIPILFPTGTTQARIVEGDVPTSGSGSGPGYIYTVSGSVITVNFTPSFPATPSVQATGFRSSGSSTVTLASVSPTALSISFSTGTQTVHFAASLLK